MEDLAKLHSPENALARVEFSVPGKPLGKQDSRKSKTGVSYVPTETKNYLSLVRLAAAAVWSGKPLEGPVGLEIIAVYPIPKSWSKKRKEEALRGLIEPAKKPDLTNILKAVEDGMQGVIIYDDDQVCAQNNLKKYGLKPEVRVVVTESPMRGL